jgi:class 3 adenylate cyclase/pimeloyl-ACP methyl ester carboxylesterase
VLSETRYAPSGDLRVAYRATTAGSRDIVFVSNWFTSCEVLPEVSSIQGWIERMSNVGRLIFFDQPGTGSSDSVALDSLPTLEQWSDSITAVLDELNSPEAVLVTIDGAFATGALFAATHPRRTSALVVLEGYAATSPADADLLPAAIAMWGTGELQHVLNPDMPWSEEIRSQWARQERLAASPNTVALIMPLLGLLDVRELLPSIRVPTLVLQHTDDPLITPTQGQYIANNIRDAKYVELPGRNMYHFVEPGAHRCVEEISEFLTGARGPVDDDRVLATVLFTDIVDSTRRAADIGDRDWRALLDAHDAVVRSQLSRYRGREVNTAGDSFLATFDGPQRAIRCAMSIRDAVRPLGIEVRAGLHTGECELRGDDIGGIAVHIGARVCRLAQASEVLVSGTLRDLVIGSGLQFDERGVHELKGVPGEWRLFALAAAQP